LDDRTLKKNQFHHVRLINVKVGPADVKFFSLAGRRAAIAAGVLFPVRLQTSEAEARQVPDHTQMHEKKNGKVSPSPPKHSIISLSAIGGLATAYRLTAHIQRISALR
jgi:hypothetical protein